MIEQTLLLKLSSPGLADDKTSQLRQEDQVFQKLFQSQATLTQQYLAVQAASLAEAIVQGLPQVRFMLPDAVNCVMLPGDCVGNEIVPPGSREQVVRAGLARLLHPNLLGALNLRLNELERSSDRAISMSAGLLRYAITIHMVNNMLPAGRSVVYQAVTSEDIPNIPVDPGANTDSALKSGIDGQALVGKKEDGRGELMVPYVEAARLFYLPQWIAFDNHGCLLLGSVSEAEAHIASMQRYLSILQSAVVIAPYIVTDEVWQQKRYGMMGQLVNQGRALARFQSRKIIEAIKRRVEEHRMNRGLRLSLPYFNDQTMRVESHHFMVIPAGRIMFVPAFAVLAAREQQLKVANNLNLSFATRKHLIVELREFELAFTK